MKWNLNASKDAKVRQTPWTASTTGIYSGKYQNHVGMQETKWEIYLYLG